MKTYALGLGLALMVAGHAAIAADAPGFNVSAATRVTPGFQNADARARSVGMAAERLRLGLSLNPKQFAQGATPLEQVALFEAFGPVNDESGIYLSWFFRGAVQRVAADARMPIITFYNPLADVAAVTSWRRIDAVWQISAVSFVDGAQLRDTGKAAPWWSVRNQPYQQALAERSAASLSGVQAIGAKGLLVSDLPRAGLEARLVGLAASVQQLHENKALGAAAERLRVAMRDANPAKSGVPLDQAPAASQLQGLAPDVRNTLAVVSVIARGDGLVVALASPLKPDLVIFADYASVTAIAPLHVAFLNFAERG